MDERKLQYSELIKSERRQNRTDKSANESDPGLLWRHRRKEFLREYLAERYSEGERPDIRAPYYDEKAKEQVAAEVPGLVKGDEV